MSRVLVTETEFGLVIGFINCLQLVITINYNTVSNFHSTRTPRQSSQSISTCLHYPFSGNGYQHRNYDSLTLQMLHINQVFCSHVKSSQGNELSSSINFTPLITRTLNLELWTPSLNWNISLLLTRSDLLQLRTFHRCLPPRTTRERASVSRVNPWSDTRETRALLLLRHCWRGHVIPPHSYVIQVFMDVI
jgi:hypothetical protein